MRLVLVHGAMLDLAVLRGSSKLNLISAVRLAQLAQPYLAAGTGGFIANFGSFYADLGVPGSLAHSAAKARVLEVGCEFLTGKTITIGGGKWVRA
jgi:short-subunit dehydrogenase